MATARRIQIVEQANGSRMMKFGNQQRFLMVLKSPKVLLLFLLLGTFAVWYFTYLGHYNNSKKIHSHQHSSNHFFDNKQFRGVANGKVNLFNAEKIVHLDLKGAPPKISYYEKLFPLLGALGATGILIEYEDMFPYAGKLRNVSALNSYTIEDIKTINALAIKSNLAVIPLVQTFGHLEFLLKLDEFSHLREVPEYPQVICPTHKETVDLIVNMLDQVIMAHPQIKLIHIGADEVYYIGQCQRCFDTLAQLNWSKNELFLEHILAIAKQINSKYKYLRILMWDDEFRSMSAKQLKDSRIAEFVEPVVWKYTKEVFEELGPSLWNMYAIVFPKIWIASAFKGATGSDQYLTNTAHYVQNHKSWLYIVNEYGTRINFQGIFLTGWQRYDHFAVLCELFAVAVPSLAMCLMTLYGLTESPVSPPKQVVNLLDCDHPYGLMGPAFGTPKCHYPGGDVLEAILRFQQLKQDFQEIQRDPRVNGWITDYNIKHSFSSPQHVVSALLELDHIEQEFLEIDEEITNSMLEIYDNYTVNEWRETYLEPLRKQILYLLKAKDRLLSKKSWPRRPFIGGN